MRLMSKAMATTLGSEARTRAIGRPVTVGIGPASIDRAAWCIDRGFESSAELKAGNG